MHISKTTKGKKKEQHVNISIPKEVVVEILQRVPCQDLCETLKKVCMQWCSIIYSGSFAYSHVERGILKSSSSFLQLDAVVISRTDDARSVTVSSMEWHSFPNYPRQEHEEDWKTEYMYTVNNVLDRIGTVYDMFMMRANSVNGFVCFWSADARLHVCNPITKEYFTTPPYTTFIQSSIIQLAAIGFGFCQLSYEYKVVVLQDTEIEYSQIKPSVFTIGTDRSWRSLKPIPDTKFLPDIQIFSGVHVKGVLYWYIKTCCRTNWLHNIHKCKLIKSLICFDVTKEDVDMIMIPTEINSLEGEAEGRYVIVCIAEKGGNLCLINISYGPICSLLIQVYVAHNNTGTDHLSSLNSWKKELTVTVPNMAYDINVRHLFVLMVTDEMLVIRLSRDDTYGFFDVATGMLLGVFSVDSWATFIPYVPSLVSVFHCPPLVNSSFRC